MLGVKCKRAWRPSKVAARGKFVIDVYCALAKQASESGSQEVIPSITLMSATLNLETYQIVNALGTLCSANWIVVSENERTDGLCVVYVRPISPNHMDDVRLTLPELYALVQTKVVERRVEVVA